MLCECNFLFNYLFSDNDSGPVHTETFPCVLILFTVFHYLKQYKNAGKRFRVYDASEAS